MNKTEIEESPATGGGRVVATVEVLLAFVVVHVAYRALKHFTALGRMEGNAGLNFSPGLVMILFTFSLLIFCRRSFTLYGLSVGGWRVCLNLGLLWGLLMVAGAALLAWVGISHHPGGKPPGMKAGLSYGLASLGGVVLFAWLLRSRRIKLDRIPATVGLVVLACILGAPLVAVSLDPSRLGHTMLTVLWLVFGAACGEEVYYRGYIQSRLNLAFGRPWHFLGREFGIGLLVSSLLFGFLHALNSVDYFQGRFTFAWGFGVANFGTGLLYGCLRESTGSVLAGMVTHATLDVLVIIPGLLAGT